MEIQNVKYIYLYYACWLCYTLYIHLATEHCGGLLQVQRQCGSVYLFNIVLHLCNTY